VVAVDAVGAGFEEYVLYATGFSARQTETTKNKPCDAVVMAIVDEWSISDRLVYSKGGAYEGPGNEEDG
jgi:microcompartment protein CcmK/EutM